MGSEGREAIGHDDGYDGEVFYLGIALETRLVEGFVEDRLVRIGEDYQEGGDRTILRRPSQPSAPRASLDRNSFPPYRPPGAERALVGHVLRCRLGR